MKNKLNISVATTIKEYSQILLGLFLYVLGWSVFLLPYNMVGGGVSGICAILYYSTGIDMGLSNLVINGVLLIIAVIVLGRSFGMKTIFAILATSFFFAVLPDKIPEAFIASFAGDKMICSIIGGIMAGVGVGISISVGGSSGGTDIIALLYCKYRNASPGRVILIIDVFIILSSMFFTTATGPGIINLLLNPSLSANVEQDIVNKIVTAVYGLIQITACGYTIDIYISGTKQSVQAFIFSKKFKEIADAVAYELKRGVTIIPGKGWFTKSDTNIVMVVTRKDDLNYLLRYVKTIDPDAFLSVSNVMGVYGKGFDTIKVKSNDKKSPKENAKIV